jgi:hypothetical protein
MKPNITFQREPKYAKDGSFIGILWLVVNWAEHQSETGIAPNHEVAQQEIDEALPRIKDFCINCHRPQRQHVNFVQCPSGYAHSLLVL